MGRSKGTDKRTENRNFLSFHFPFSLTSNFLSLFFSFLFSIISRVPSHSLAIIQHICSQSYYKRCLQRKLTCFYKFIVDENNVDPLTLDSNGGSDSKSLNCRSVNSRFPLFLYLGPG